MRVLVIGSGGREHALAWRLSKSPRVSAVFASPGNPGIAQVATCIPNNDATPSGWLGIARSIDAILTVVGPEAPLVAGIVDAFRAAGMRIIGPTAAAAQLEGSKAFSKTFMQRAGVPTGHAVTVPDANAARSHIGDFGYPTVLKADGLAAGKGVVIAHSEPQALDALAQLPTGKIVIEEFLQGEEVSFIVLADGATALPLDATQDHKTVHDGDTGPNTGGMGAYCDGRILTQEQTASVMHTIIHPTLAQMTDDGTPYTGFLYAGLMMTAAGPKVLEYNARLGDPETQPLLHRLDSDLLTSLLDNEPFRWKSDPSVCVVLAAHGYPGTVRSGDIITGIESCGQLVFQAGTRTGLHGLETAGGRVLGVTASGSDLNSTIENAYQAVRQIHFDGMHYRGDIGRKGLKRW